MCSSSTIIFLAHCAERQSMRNSEKSKLVERFKKACLAKDEEKKNQILDKLRKTKAEDRDWLEFMAISLFAYVFYLSRIGYPSSNLLVELLKNTSDESTILDPLFEKAKESKEQREELDKLLKSNMALIQMVANNIWYCDYIEKMIDDCYKNMLMNLEQIEGRLKEVLIKKLLKDEHIDDIVFSYKSQALKKYIYLRLIVENAKTGDYETMWKHAQTAQSKLGLEFNDVYQKLEETSLKPNSLRNAEKQNLRIAKRVIAERKEGKG